MGKGAVAGAVALGLVAGGLWVVDEFARGNAEDLAADAVTLHVDATDGPFGVEIRGFPFLTQYLRGSFDDVRGTATSITHEGVTVTDVTAELADVTTREPYTVGDMRVEATVPIDTLRQIAEPRTRMEIAVDGDVLRASGEVGGFPVSAALLPRAEGGTLVIDLQEVQLGPATIALDQLPPDVVEGLSGIEVPIEGLPDGVVLADARVVPQGVRFTATGTDVVLEDLR